MSEYYSNKRKTKTVTKIILTAPIVKYRVLKIITNNVFIDHFFLAASFLLQILITPTATVCFISLTANLPNGGYSENVSQHIGLDGFIRHKAESPFLMNFGSYYMTFPVLLSIFDWI